MKVTTVFYFALIMALATAKRYDTVSGGPYFNLIWDNASQKFNFNIVIPSTYKDLWLIFASDTTKQDLDIVQFTTSFGGSVKDAMGSILIPQIDKGSQDFKDIKIANLTGNAGMNFTATRVKDTGDTKGMDYLFPCGKGKQTFTWLVNPGNVQGTWVLDTEANCTIKENSFFAPADGLRKLQFSEKCLNNIPKPWSNTQIELMAECATGYIPVSKPTRVNFLGGNMLKACLSVTSVMIGLSMFN